MKRYINKDDVIAEIERKRNEYINSLMTAQVHTLNDMLDFINTLDVKEVDFETEWKKYFEHKGNLATVNVKDLAKHFFELELNTQKGE